MPTMIVEDDEGESGMVSRFIIEFTDICCDLQNTETHDLDCDRSFCGLTHLLIRSFPGGILKALYTAKTLPLEIQKS